MSNFRDGRKNRYRMSGDSTTPERGDTSAIVFFSISIYQEIKTSGGQHPLFNPSCHLNRIDLILRLKGSIKDFPKMKERSCQVRLGRLWTYQHAAWSGLTGKLYNILARFTIHLYFLLSAHCWLLSSWSRHQTTHISITRQEIKQAHRSSCELLRQNVMKLHGSSSASSWNWAFSF